MRFRSLLAGAAVALASVIGVNSFAASPISSGGSIFPLTFISQPLNNSVDEFNQWLILANSQLVGLSTVYAGAVTIPPAGVDTSGVVASSNIQQNPLMQMALVKALVSNNTGGFYSTGFYTVLASQSGRTIYPGIGTTIMASGTAAGATSIVLECSGATSGGGTVIATIPIADLVSLVPVPIFLSGATLNNVGAPVATGCPSGQGIFMSNVGAQLTTTTYIYLNMPYTVQ